jgi:hypothetical protein
MSAARSVPQPLRLQPRSHFYSLLAPGSTPVLDTDSSGATTENASLVALYTATDASGATTEAVALVAQIAGSDSSGATSEVSRISVASSDSWRNFF